MDTGALLEAERPAGDATALAGLADRHEMAARALTDAAQQLGRMVAHVLGQSWSGQAAAACAASCVRCAQALLVAGDAYGTAANALRQHAVRLGAAQEEYDAARRLAEEALAEERAHQEGTATSIGDASGRAFGEFLWKSPLRAVARSLAERAAAEAAASAREAAGLLEETLAPLRPAASAPVEQPDDDSFASGLLHSLASQAWGFVEPVFQGAAGISYAQSTPAQAGAAPHFSFATDDPHSVDQESLIDVINRARSGQWSYALGYGVGFLLPSVGPGAAAGAARAGSRSAVAVVEETTATAVTKSAGTKVGDALTSIDDVLANPRLLAGRTPAEVEAVIGDTPGWRLESLGRGRSAGKGWVLREYNARGYPSGPQIRWHPGGGHHGAEPYWRVVGPNGDLGGIIR